MRTDFQCGLTGEAARVRSRHRQGVSHGPRGATKGHENAVERSSRINNLGRVFRGAVSGLTGGAACLRARLRSGLSALPLFVLALAALTGCRQDMQDQPKYIPLRPSEFFTDGRSARPLPEGARVLEVGSSLRQCT